MVRNAAHQQLVAKTATLEQIQLDMRKKLRTNNNNKNKSKKTKTTTNRGQVKKGNKKSKKQDKGKNKWAWKEVKPKPGQPLTKTFESKVYHWCKHHQKWTLHTENECRLNEDNNDSTSGDDDVVNLQAALDADFES